MDKENAENIMGKGMEEKKTAIIIGQRILRGIMRPVMHIGAELASIGVLGLISALAAAVIIGAAMLMTAWAREVTGIAPNTAQDAVLVLATCGAAAYVFFTEANRIFTRLRGWTDHIHKWIA